MRTRANLPVPQWRVRSDTGTKERRGSCGIESRECAERTPREQRCGRSIRPACSGHHYRWSRTSRLHRSGSTARSRRCTPHNQGTSRPCIPHPPARPVRTWRHRFRRQSPAPRSRARERSGTSYRAIRFVRCECRCDTHRSTESRCSRRGTRLPTLELVPPERLRRARGRPAHCVCHEVEITGLGAD